MDEKIRFKEFKFEENLKLCQLIDNKYSADLLKSDSDIDSDNFKENKSKIKLEFLKDNPVYFTKKILQKYNLWKENIDATCEFEKFKFNKNLKFCQLIANKYSADLLKPDNDDFKEHILEVHLKFYIQIKKNLLAKEISKGHKDGRFRFFGSFTTKEKIAAAELIENTRRLTTPEERVHLFFNSVPSRIREAAKQGTLGRCVKRFVTQLYEEQEAVLNQKLEAIAKNHPRQRT